MKWEDPPVPQQGGIDRTNWSNIAEELEANPGRWALVKTYPRKPTSVYSWLQTRYGLEVALRKADEGYKLYARYQPREDTT